MLLAPGSVQRFVSLLLVLARLRTKALPKALAIVEAVIRTKRLRKADKELIGRHLGEHLDELATNASENLYSIMWIGYFMRANGLDSYLKKRYWFKDPVVRAVFTSRFTQFAASKDYNVFRGVKTSAKATSLLEHLDVFAR